MRRWDIFCRVVDNFGDIGTCWRLAQQLANEYEADVRLWVDNLESFARLCPSISPDAAEQQIGPIEVRHWRSDMPDVAAADVVIEAFACELPESYVIAMARRAAPPVWINLEYLSTEAWVETCHLLKSPHPKFPLTKHFFFPGVTSGTGGLLQERGLLATRAAFDRAAAAGFWRSVGLAPPAANELRVSLFCYENAALPDLLQSWADGPADLHVLVSPGAAIAQVAGWFGKSLTPGTRLQRKALTGHARPFLQQPDYDRLLWACDVNFVRGEDSFVRAQWAQRPFVWQIYPQADDVHLAKLNAFLAHYLSGSPDAAVIRSCWQAWNGAGEMGAAWRAYLARRQAIEQHGRVWASQLDGAGNLANNLSRFMCGN